jgi:ribonuclease PH
LKNNKDTFFRSDNRQPEQMRPVNIIPEFISTAEGSALIEVGNTRVICTASIEESVPGFMKGTGKGWITAAPLHTHTHRARSQPGPPERTHP